MVWAWNFDSAALQLIGVGRRAKSRPDEATRGTEPQTQKQKFGEECSKKKKFGEVYTASESREGNPNTATRVYHTS